VLVVVLVINLVPVELHYLIEIIALLFRELLIQSRLERLQVLDPLVVVVFLLFNLNQAQVTLCKLTVVLLLTVPAVVLAVLLLRLHKVMVVVPEVPVAMVDTAC
jgi:hypothetical protein